NEKAHNNWTDSDFTFLVSKYILTQVHISKIIRNNELIELHCSLDSVIDLGNIKQNSTINFFFFLKMRVRRHYILVILVLLVDVQM
ncbi:MAG: hypothetical protein ACK52X_00815, partial [bacterium]